MASKLSKQAARNAGDTLDKAADLITKGAAAFGIKPEIAKKFAMQCDLLSDHIAKSAGADIAKLADQRKQGLTGDDVFDEGAHIGEDPEIIGEEKSGPKEQETDEPYMAGHFSQQENRELREKQEAGELPTGSPDRQTPHAGIQASLETGKRLASLYLDINNAASKLAASEHPAVKGLGTKLASAGLDVLQFQTRVLEGSESEERVAALTRAAGHVLPHLAGDVPVIAAEKLGRMTDIFAGLAKSA